MSWTVPIPRPLRLAVMWLPMVCAVLAPAWFAATASGSSDACGCDASHADHHAEVVAEDAADGDECPDECPSECPGDCANCSCCAAVTPALPPLSLPAAAVTFVELADVAPADSPSSGVGTYVFRPPRALT